MQTLEEKIEQAQNALDQGDHATAGKLFQEVLDENGEKWMAWRGLGFVYLNDKRDEDAVKAFQKARVIRSDDVMSQYGYGIALQNTGDHGAAIRAFEESLRHDHKHADSKRAIAISLLAQVDHMREIGNLIAVEEYLEKAHRFDPENEDTTVALLSYYEKTGQAAKIQNVLIDLKRHGHPIPDRSQYGLESQAVEKQDTLPTSTAELRALIADQRENWRAWRALGQNLLDEGDAKSAEEAYKKATVIRSDDVESQLGLGLALQMQGDHNHAIHAFEAGLAHDRTHRATKTALNVSLLAYVDHMEEIRNLLAVEQYLEKAHKNDITDEAITKRLLRYYGQTGQAGKSQLVGAELARHGLAVPVVDEIPEVGAEVGSDHKEDEVNLDSLSVSDLKAKLAENGENWQAWRALGFAQIKDGDAQSAADSFKRATVIRFDDAESQYGLGLAHQKLGDHAHAIHPFEEALNHNPRHEDAKNALKTSLLAYSDHMKQIGNLLAVEQFLEKAYKCDLTDMDVAKSLFDYYKETGQGNKASKLANDLGYGADEPTPTEHSASTSDDLLITTTYQEEQAAHHEQANYGSGDLLPDQGYKNTEDVSPPAQTVQVPMARCPGCKQFMPGTSRLCPHCSAVVDLARGVVIGGNAQNAEKSEKKLFGIFKRKD